MVKDFLNISSMKKRELIPFVVKVGATNFKGYEDKIIKVYYFFEKVNKFNRFKGV